MNSPSNSRHVKFHMELERKGDENLQGTRYSANRLVFLSLIALLVLILLQFSLFLGSFCSYYIDLTRVIESESWNLNLRTSHIIYRVPVPSSTGLSSSVSAMTVIVPEAKTFG